MPGPILSKMHVISNLGYFKKHWFGVIWDFSLWSATSSLPLPAAPQCVVPISARIIFAEFYTDPRVNVSIIGTFPK